MLRKVFYVQYPFFNVIVLIIFIVTLSYFTSYSQLKSLEIISTSGGYFSNSKMQLSWTIGEPVIETCEGGNLCLTQGFHQSNLTVTAIEELETSNFKILAYPNPATDFVQLRIESDKIEKMEYLLFSSDGKLITTKEIVNNQASIPMKNFARSTYILKVMNKKGVFKTFRIIKNE